MNCRVLLVFRAACLALALHAAAMQSLAQDAPAPDALKDLHNKDALNDQERGTIQQWVETQVAAITSGDGATAEQAIHTLRDARTGANGFREAYAAACIRAVGASFKKASLSEAVQLIAVLNELNEATANEVLIDALKDNRAAVRTAAAVGLRKLRPKISIAGGKFFSDSLEALKEAAIKEDAALALKTMYQAMNFPEAVPNPPEPKAIVEAVLAVLEARAELYVSGNVRAEGADLQGIKTATGLKQFMSPADQKRLVVATAKMLRHAVRRYTSAATGDDGVKIPPGPRREIELLVIEAEKLLADNVPVAGEKPNIVRWMEKVDQTRMKIEFNKWAAALKKSTDVDLDLQSDPTTQPGE